MRSAWSKGFRCGWQLGIVATKLDVVLRLSVKAPTSSVLLTNNSNVMIMLSLIPVRCAARLANISLCTASSFALSLSLFVCDSHLRSILNCPRGLVVILIVYQLIISQFSLIIQINGDTV
jgi:hypothetical protein